MPKVSVLIPCYKRHEYTKKCLDKLRENTKLEDVEFFLVDDGSDDEKKTSDLLRIFAARVPNTHVIVNDENMGLRDVIIDFFERAEGEYLCKIDNDCLVPKGWLKGLLKVHEETDVEILSPNVEPSNAGLRNGVLEGGYLRVDSPGKMGGLWIMRRDLIENCYFEKTGNGGIGLAHAIIELIYTQTDCNAGWTDKVTLQDIGHWSGIHPDHIKSEDHYIYSAEVGRGVAW